MVKKMIIKAKCKVKAKADFPHSHDLLHEMCEREGERDNRELYLSLLITKWGPLLLQNTTIFLIIYTFGFTKARLNSN